MKIINSNVSILPQDPGVEGLYKLIEKVARTSYKSENKISDDSYKKFNEMIYNRGHWAVFNLGSVYLKVPHDKYVSELDILSVKPYSSYTRWNMKDGNYLISTNYRVICQTGLQNIMEKFWSDPTEEHFHRITTKWICSRSISQEVMRHRVFSYCQESTRYCNYSKSKFNSELTFILPQWVYKVRDKIINTDDSIDKEKLLSLDGQELWDFLCKINWKVRLRDNFYRNAELEYLSEIKEEEGEKLKAEDARDCLPLGLKTEFCMSGFVSDFMYVPDKNTTEKSGFFYLRSANDAHPDIKYLSDKLLEQFKENGIDKLK